MTNLILTLIFQSSIINKLSHERHNYETSNAMVFVCSSSEQNKTNFNNRIMMTTPKILYKLMNIRNLNESK